MKRRLTKLVVFLLLGAIVNVAVSWTITALPPWSGWPQQPILLTQIEWPRPVPQHWPSRANSIQARVFGQSAQIYFANVLEETETPDGELWATEQFVIVTEELVINIGTVGWPCLALQWEVWLDDVLPRGGAAGGPHRADGQPVDTWWLGGVDLPFEKFGFGQQGWKRLPVRPIWPGFAVNTIFYGAILSLLTLGPVTARRFIRRRHGHCVKCGYDLRGAEHEVCPECGQTISSTAPTTDGNNPMNSYLRFGLMNQIEMQCRFVIMAHEQLKIASSVTKAFYAIHALLTAAANVSKAAWGMGGTKSKYYSERAPLRQALSLTDDSPLYPLLDVRNGYEHYDQRLTDVIAENPSPFIVDSSVGPPDAVKMQNKIQLRHFDNTTSDVHFLGHKLNLNDLVSEVQRILPLVQSEASSSGPTSSGTL